MRKFLKKVFIIYLTYLIGLSSMAPARTGRTAFEKTLEVSVLNPQGLEFKEFETALVEGRENTPFFENRSKFRFRVFSQAEKSPLIVLVPGLGASIDNRGTTYIAEFLFQKGYHVLVVPNNITVDFALQVSQGGMPGIVSEDARDLRRALHRSLQILREEKIEWEETYLMGYSMGALLSAYISYQNDNFDKRPLNIDRTLLINPPIDFLASMKLLDSWNESFRGKAPLYRSYVEVPTLLSVLWGTIQSNRTSHPSKKSMARFGDLLMGIPQEQLKGALAYGLLRRFTRFVYATQQVSDQGLFGLSDLKDRDRYRQAAKVSLSQYTHEYISRYKGLDSIDELSKKNNFKNLESYFLRNESIYMIHSADDIIVDSQEIHRASQLFGDRAYVFATGGHMGYIWEESFKSKVLEFLGNKKGSPDWAATLNP